VIIKSILDNDLYKFTMQNAVLEHFPDATVSYKFTNRDPSMKFNEETVDVIKTGIKDMEQLRFTGAEIAFLKERCPYLSPKYLKKIRDFKFNSGDIYIDLSVSGDLLIYIGGNWFNTILWEVPLLAIISECYFQYKDTDWDYNSVVLNALKKATRMTDINGKWSDFGTRRRRSYVAQELVVETFATFRSKAPNFFGTSNVHLAKKFDITAVGTMAHEWIMGTWGACNCDPYEANVIALTNWIATYGNNLGIALTDTFGTDCFFAGFNEVLAKAYDGVRHDSGDPLVFVDKTLNHYEKLGIDPKNKLIVFSDSLNVDKALAIDKYCSGKIGYSFGIGTYFTNDFINLKTQKKSKPLNIVIKLLEINNTMVAKLSDDFTKATGDAKAIDKLLEFVRK
jgi:nicotinate phosphoribosyltransferase